MKGTGIEIPLNCVDKCLLALDGIDEPVTTYAILDLEGEVDPVRLNQAIRHAQMIHPRMRTLLRRKGLRAFREVQEEIEPDALITKDLTQAGSPTYNECFAQILSQRIDVRKEFPFRVHLVKKNPLESFLAFTFNHSALDGLRALLFVRTVTESYNGDMSEPPEVLDDPRMYSDKDELLEFAKSQTARVEKYKRKMVSYLFHRFVTDAWPPPTRVFHDRNSKSKDLAHCSRAIVPSELDELVSRATAARVELNDILLASLHRTVEKWNRLHGKPSNKIRIMAPVNLSPKGFRNIVSNQASWLSLSTWPEDRADPVQLLRKVRADAVDATHNRMAFSLVYFFCSCARFPLFAMRGMCRFLMVSRTYVDSILLTNLGPTWLKVGSDEPAVTGLGDARIVNLAGSTSVVSPMGISLCLGSYGKRFTVSAAYRPAMFSREKIERFLDLYVSEVLSYPLGKAQPVPELAVSQIA